MSLLEILKKIFSSLLQNKSKILILILSTIVFIFILFPFDELGDLVSSQVAKMTGNQLSIQFDRMSLNLFPIGVQFGNVHVDPANAPSLSADELGVHPSIAGLISQKPYGSISADGFLKGNLNVKVSSAPKTEKGTERHRLEISAKKISLNQIRQMANLPVNLKGSMNIDTTAMADLALIEQPEVSELSLSINQFELPSGSINMNGFEVTIPGLKLSQLELKGRMNEGKFYIESSQIGKPGDEVVGQVKGTWNIEFINAGGRPMPRFGAYDLQLDLKLKKSFQEKASSYLLFVDNFKKPMADGSAQYKIKLVGVDMIAPPRMIPIN